MIFFKVKNELYRSPDMQSSKDGKHWENAKPELLSPNLAEWFLHLIGRHFSWGQPYCAVCGKTKVS